MNILAALDFSETTPEVLTSAKRLAGALKSHLWLVHVEAPDPDFVGYDAGPQSVRDQVSREIHTDHQQLQSFAEKCREDDLQVTALLLQGPTAQTLVDKAEQLGAEFLVVGSHGKTGLRKLLMGSVSEAILRSAPCPVVVVRG